MSNMPLTRTEADETITRLQGEARVMRDLLQISLGLIEAFESENCEESEELMGLTNDIRAVLKARTL